MPKELAAKWFPRRQRQGIGASAAHIRADRVPQALMGLWIVGAHLALVAAPAAAQNPVPAELGRRNPIDEGYLAEFSRCDRSDEFRGVKLPWKNARGQTVYYGCRSDPNRVTAFGRHNGAVILEAKLGVDLDGSWYACNTPGMTDLCDTSLMLDGGRRPTNSDRIPYVVIPVRGPTAALGREFRDTTGVRMGDFGMAIYGETLVPVIVADGGPFNKLGEGSIALHRKFGQELCRTRNAAGECSAIVRPLSSISQGVTVVIFPGSARRDLTTANVARLVECEGARLYRTWRGEVSGACP